jgi:XTP/dITP diphosphohydrolase
MLELVAVMDRLRSPGGCPWDAEQTHESLRRYLLEETYEVLDAIESGSPEALQEELGDLLLQVVFHARIAEESTNEPWGIDQVAQGIIDKLIRRHPHVFAGVVVDDADDVASRWDRAKRAEKGRTSVLDGVPTSQPSLALAEAYLGRVERGAELVPPRVPGNEGISLLVAALTDDTERGDVLLGLVSAARARGWDAEAALRQAALRYGEAVRRAESP